MKYHYEREPRKFPKPGGVIPFSEEEEGEEEKEEELFLSVRVFIKLGKSKPFLWRDLFLEKGMISWQPRGKSQVDRLILGRSCHVISCHGP